MSNTLSLFLEEIDLETRSVARDWELGEVDLGELARRLGRTFTHLIDNAYYDLQEHEVREISKWRLGDELSFPWGMLRQRHALLDSLPYKVHTRRELLMMLEGRKPLTHFVFGPDEDFTDIIGPFLPYVGTKLRASVALEDWDGQFFMISFYMLPGEEWRAEAMLDVFRKGRETGWTDELTRREGELLGYEDWQTDAFLKMRREMLERTGAG